MDAYEMIYNGPQFYVANQYIRLQGVDVIWIVILI